MDTKMIILTGIVLFTIDILFITYIFSNEYKSLIKSVQKSKLEINYIAGFITFIILIFGFLTSKLLFKIFGVE